MAGYAATMRIERAAPRFRPGRAPADDAPEIAPPAAVVEMPGARPVAAIEDVSGEPFAARIAYLWDDVRDAWRQGMRVLADPEGWR